jgi:hypothetical protein
MLDYIEFDIERLVLAFAITLLISVVAYTIAKIFRK